MIIVLKPNTSDKDIARVEHQIKRNGLDTHIVRGQEMTIIGCIGDTSRLDARLFEVDASVDKVMHVQEPYKLSNRAFHPEDSIIDVSGVKVGGDNLALIAFSTLGMFLRETGDHLGRYPGAFTIK